MSRSSSATCATWRASSPAICRSDQRPAVSSDFERLLYAGLALASIALSGLPVCPRLASRAPRRGILGYGAHGLGSPRRGLTQLLIALLIMAFALRLDWLPVVGADSPSTSSCLPTLSLPSAAVLAGSSVPASDVIGADFVRTAYAKASSAAK